MKSGVVAACFKGIVFFLVSTDVVRYTRWSKQRALRNYSTPSPRIPSPNKLQVAEACTSQGDLLHFWNVELSLDQITLAASSNSEESQHFARKSWRAWAHLIWSLGKKFSKMYVTNQFSHLPLDWFSTRSRAFHRGMQVCGLSTWYDIKLLLFTWIGQTIGLIGGKELYTKACIAKEYQPLSPFLYRSFVHITTGHFLQRCQRNS